MWLLHTTWETQSATTVTKLVIIIVIRQNQARLSPTDIPKWTAVESAAFAAQRPSILTLITKYNFLLGIILYSPPIYAHLVELAPPHPKLNMWLGQDSRHGVPLTTGLGSELSTWASQIPWASGKKFWICRERTGELELLLPLRDLKSRVYPGRMKIKRDGRRKIPSKAIIWAGIKQSSKHTSIFNSVSQ